MEKPGLVTMFNKIHIDIKYKVYCEYMNRIIRGIIREKGDSISYRVPCDKLYYYGDGKLRFRIERYKSGDEHYYIYAKPVFWKDIPEGINPYMICDYTGIRVYHFQYGLGGETLHLNIPGEWEKEIPVYESIIELAK